jgi:hypothetical protein
VSAAVWALSPWLVGHREPWDAGGFFYLIALAAAGCVAGWVTPRPLWAHYVGAVVGQLLYEVLFLRIGPLFVLGIGFLLGYSLIFVVAAAMSGYLHTRLAPRPTSR